LEKSFTQSSISAGRSIKTLKIDKALIDALEKIPYSKCSAIDIPEDLLRLYIKYVWEEHREKDKVVIELNKAFGREVKERTWRKKAALSKQLDNKQ
jgi:hypothetical protein